MTYEVWSAPKGNQFSFGFGRWVLLFFLYLFTKQTGDGNWRSWWKWKVVWIHERIGPFVRFGLVGGGVPPTFSCSSRLETKTHSNNMKFRLPLDHSYVSGDGISNIFWKHKLEMGFENTNIRSRRYEIKMWYLWEKLLRALKIRIMWGSGEKEKIKCKH